MERISRFLNHGNNPRATVLTILLIGLALRLIWFIYAAPDPVSDFADYYQLAENLIAHGQYGYPEPTAYWLPGYPAFLALFSWISQSTSWLSFVSVLLSTMLIYLVYRLATLATGDALSSILAALFCALNPIFVFFSPVLASEHLFSALLFTSLLILLGAASRGTNTRRALLGAALAGILYGIVVLTRGEGLFYLPVFALAAYFVGIGRTRRLAALLIVLFAASLVVAPWYVRNQRVLGPGSGLSTTSGLNFHFAHNPDHVGDITLKGSVFENLHEVERGRLGYEMGFEHLRSAGAADILKDILRGTRKLYFTSGRYSVQWSTQSSVPGQDARRHYRQKDLAGIALLSNITRLSPILSLIAFIAILVAWRSANRRTWFLLAALVLMHWIGYTWFFWAKPRYR